MANSQQIAQLANMWHKLNLSIPIIIIIFNLLVFSNALPVDVPRYNQLSHKPPQSINSTALPYTTDRLGGRIAEQSVTTPTPQFEYALLGQDPADQHWFRVSLTPTDNKVGYRAQFATRKSPPYDAQMAHKHDKTIHDLLNFLEKSEEHNLLKVYGQLLASEDHDESKIKRNVENEHDFGHNLVEVEHKSLLKTDEPRPLLLVGELSGSATPTTNQTGTDNSMVKNFVYFIKGLK